MQKDVHKCVGKYFQQIKSRRTMKKKIKMKNADVHFLRLLRIWSCFFPRSNLFLMICMQIHSKIRWNSGWFHSEQYICIWYLLNIEMIAWESAFWIAKYLFFFRNLFLYDVQKNANTFELEEEKKCESPLMWLKSLFDERIESDIDCHVNFVCLWQFLSAEQPIQSRRNKWFIGFQEWRKNSIVLSYGQ